MKQAIHQSQQTYYCHSERLLCHHNRMMCHFAQTVYHSKQRQKICFLLVFLVSLIFSCTNIADLNSDEKDNLKFEETLTLSANVCTPERSALPTMELNSLVYAAVLHKDEISDETKLTQGTIENSKLTFTFEKITEKNDLILDIFAFSTSVNVNELKRPNAFLAGKYENINITSSTYTISNNILLKRNTAATAKGSVNLNIQVPTGYSLSCVCNNPTFTITVTDSIYNISASDVSAGEYAVTFVLKKDDVEYAWAENITVLSGMETNKWNPSVGSIVNDNLVIEESSIKTESVFYVRGSEGAWYSNISESFSVAAGSDLEGNGSLAKPYATVQKALSRVIGINNVATTAQKYKIYVDGTIKNSNSAALADFSAVTKELELEIIGLSASTISTILNANSWNGIYIPADCKKINLTLKNLELNNGMASSGTSSKNGAGICLNSNSILTCENCYINSCITEENGGAIYAPSASEVILKKCIIGDKTENSTGKQNFAMNGGAIYTEGKLTLDSTIIINNSVSINGGGIYAKNAEVVIQSTLGNNSELSYNIASNTNNSIETEGGAIYLENSKLTMDGVIIKNNQAVGMAAGIYIDEGSSSYAEIKNLISSGNIDGLTNNVIFANGNVKLSGSVNIQDSIFVNKEKLLELGSDFSLADGANPVSICVNHQNIDIGGVIFFASNLTQVLFNRFVYKECADIYKNYKMVFYEAKNKAILDTTTTVYVSTTGNDSWAGDFANPFKTVQKAVDSVIDKNNNDGADYEYTISVSSGTYSATANSPLVNFSNVGNKKLTVKIIGQTEDGNITFEGAGSASSVVSTGSEDTTGYKYAGDKENLSLTLKNLIITKGNANFGGGIKFYGASGCSLILDNCVLTGNTGSYGGAIMICGGNLYLKNGTVIGDKNNSTVASGADFYNAANYSTGNGGGITLCPNNPTDEDSIYCNIGTGCYVARNYCSSTGDESGGGIFLQRGAILQIEEGAYIQYNGAGSYGGGIGTNYSTGYSDFKCKVTSSGNIIGNTAGTAGGGVFIETGTFTVNGGTISNNTSNKAGAIYFAAKKESGTLIPDSGSSGTIANASIVGNSATLNGSGGGGGAIYLWGSEVTIENCIIDSNKSKYKGGGIYIDSSSSLTIQGTSDNMKITNNKIEDNNDVGGGGIYLGKTLVANGGTISGNTASSGKGNNIYYKSGATYSGSAIPSEGVEQE